MHTTSDSNIVTTREALAILGKSDPSTIAYYVRDGRLTPAHKAPGLRGAFFFNRADVEALAESIKAAS